MDLAAAVAGVEEVRRRRPGGGVPLRVWDVAVGLAGCYGAGRTARALGLDARELERRLGRRRRARRAAPARVPAFVEIVPRPEVASGACVVEVDGGGGRTVRLRLAVADAALLERVLVALARASA